MTAKAVRSVAVLAEARRRRPLPAETLGDRRNIATGLGDLGVAPFTACAGQTKPVLVAATLDGRS